MSVQRNGGPAEYQVARFKNGGGVWDHSAIVDLENGDALPTQWRLAVGGSGNGLGLSQGQFYIESHGPGIAMQLDANKDAHFYPSGGGSCNLTNGAAGWSCSSDRNLKENIVGANGEEILARVAEIPVSRWNMKGSDVTHIGPMAQDFHAAFGVGEDDKHINTVDAQGVALAAIQGLYRENQELKAQNERQQKELAELESRVVALEGQATGTGAIGWRDVVTGAAVALVAVVFARRRTHRDSSPLEGSATCSE